MLDFTFNVICIDALQSLDIALTVGFPKYPSFGFGTNAPWVVISVLNGPLWHLMHALLSKNTLSAPNFDLLEVAPMPLCNDNLVVEDDIILIDRLTNSETDAGGVLRSIIPLTVVVHRE